MRNMTTATALRESVMAVDDEIVRTIERLESLV